MENNREKGSARKRFGNLSLGLRCFLLLVLIISVGVFASRMLEYTQLIDQKNDLQNQKDQYQAQIDKMNHYSKGTINYDDIIRIAREKFNLVFPDDTVIYSDQSASGQK